MKHFRAVKSLQKFLQKERKKGKSIGFVPTMGALHKGHISLIDESIENSDLTVCSIFVNPTQFNDPKDLKKYPKTFKTDRKLLIDAGCDVVFKPPVNEIYPSAGDADFQIDLKGLDRMMEGQHRPGHFKGVVQVVKRLLDIVEPDHLYMGQKDFQQCAIISLLLQTMNSHTKLIICPTIREENGLAMSSRNLRLTKEQRADAGIIFKTLQWAKTRVFDSKPTEILNGAMKQLTNEVFKAEYFQIVDGKSLQAIDSFEGHEIVVACTAVWVGGVRLIDNLRLK